MENRPKRTYIPVRIGAKGVDWIDMVVMEENGRDLNAKFTRSDIIRISLAVAAKHDREFRALLRGSK